MRGPHPGAGSHPFVVSACTLPWCRSASQIEGNCPDCGTNLAHRRSHMALRNNLDRGRACCMGLNLKLPAWIVPKKSHRMTTGTRIANSKWQALAPRLMLPTSMSAGKGIKINNLFCGRRVQHAGYLASLLLGTDLVTSCQRIV